jgi:hypothetical protein
MDAGQLRAHSFAPQEATGSLRLLNVNPVTRRRAARAEKSLSLHTALGRISG